MLFSDLGLAPELLRAIAEEGYTQPTPIQQQAIPMVLAKRDLLAAAQTGTGKTAAFTLPILHMLHGSTAAQSGLARVLVLVPTRELAAQVADSVRTYGRYLPLRTVVLFGGVGINPQIDALRRGVDVIVATPGRLLDHVQQGTVKLGGIQMLVLDEADRMLDMGFIRDIRRVFAVLPKQRQNLLFSATFSNDIRSLAEGLLHNPASVEVAPRNTTAELVQQRVHPVDKSRKTALLAHLVKGGDWRQVLVFTRTKHGANRLADQLAKQGIETAAIHGNKSQNARTRALADFKAGKVRVLVATDIAARGIDIDQLPHVINHELPNVPEDYVHRIGRTGRAGAEGEAVSLVSSDERAYLKDIQRLLKREIPASVVPGFEPGSAPSEQERSESALATERPAPRRPSQPPSRRQQPAGRGGNGSRGGQARHPDSNRNGNSHHAGPGRSTRDGHPPARHSRPGGGKPRHGQAPNRKGS